MERVQKRGLIGAGGQWRVCVRTRPLHCPHPQSLKKFSTFGHSNSQFFKILPGRIWYLFNLLHVKTINSRNYLQICHAQNPMQVHMYCNTSNVDLHDDKIVVGYSFCSSACTLLVVDVILVSSIYSCAMSSRWRRLHFFCKESVQTYLLFSIAIWQRAQRTTNNFWEER